LKRLEGRGVSRKRAKEIMSVQVPVRILKKSADVIITNNGTMEELVEKATAVATKLKQ
jgi:dephospho-CoA kinase